MNITDEPIKIEPADRRTFFQVGEVLYICHKRSAMLPQNIICIMDAIVPNINVRFLSIENSTTSPVKVDATDLVGLALLLNETFLLVIWRRKRSLDKLVGTRDLTKVTCEMEPR
jgi:hypothetical protein